MSTRSLYPVRSFITLHNKGKPHHKDVLTVLFNQSKGLSFKKPLKVIPHPVDPISQDLKAIVTEYFVLEKVDVKGGDWSEIFLRPLYIFSLTFPPGLKIGILHVIG